MDLGTNNCRLLVARPRHGGFEVIDSFSRIVRLGEGLARSGRLDERAMARTLNALAVCARILGHHQVALSRGVATEACRRASNGEEFLTRVTRATGLALEILPHEEEAHLALLGCLPLVDRGARHVLLVDVGGGSTELLWLDRTDGDPGLVRFAVSLPVGVVSLAESFGADPDGAAFEAMVAHVDQLLAGIEGRHRLTEAFAGGSVQMIGTSGTVTTLAAVLLDLPRYDRRRIDGLTVAIEAISDVSRRLRTMDQGTRAAHPCIGTARADLVVAGSAILDAVLARWPINRLRVADRGLREGILHGLMGRRLEHQVQLVPPPPRRRNAEARPSRRAPPGPAVCAPCTPCAPCAPCSS